MTAQQLEREERDDSLAKLTLGLELETGKEYIFTIPRPKQAERLEVEDTFFNTNSAVFMPHVAVSRQTRSTPRTEFSNTQLWTDLEESHPVFVERSKDAPYLPDPVDAREMGLHAIVATLQYLEENADRKLLLAGHTDTSGHVDYNEKLSEARAQAIVALLEGSRDDFLAAIKKYHAEEDDAVVCRYVARTRGWDCDLADDAKEATPAAIKGFQRGYNATFDKSITEDGLSGPQTRGAYFDVFESDLALLAGGTASKLSTLRQQLRWVDSSKKYIACGEAYPIEAPEQDDFVSQTNRRVEVLFFEPSEVPSDMAKAEEELYGEKRRYGFTRLHRHDYHKPGGGTGEDPPEVEVVDDEPPPTGVGEPDHDLVTVIPYVENPHDDPFSFMHYFDEYWPGYGVQAKAEDLAGDPYFENPAMPDDGTALA